MRLWSVSGEVRVPHRGNVVDRVIEGAYEVVGVFDRIEEKRDAMQSLILPPPARQALAQAALTYRYGDEHRPVTTADILTPRRREDYGKDLWSTYQTIQENMLKGGIPVAVQKENVSTPVPFTTSTPILSSTAHCG